MIFATLTLAQIPVKCSNPRIRKDFRQAQQDGTWPRIVQAFRTLKHNGDMTRFAQKHYDESSHVHYTMEFLTWHRRFIWEMEDMIRGVGGNDLTLPYVDWAGEGDAYNGAIDQSSAFTEYFYGTNTQNQCVSGQIYDTFALNPRIAQEFGRGQCLMRQTSSSVSINGWAATDQMIFSSSQYQDFSSNIENSIHAYIHVKIGGLMGIMYSPIDPIFYAHHGFVDMLFTNWQYTQNQWDTNPDRIRSTSFRIFSDWKTHQQSFTMDGMCASYQRYTQSQTSPRKLKKRADTNTTTGTNNTTGANTTTGTPTTENNASPASQTEAAKSKEYPVPDYKKYSTEEVNAYNEQLKLHYKNLKDKAANKSESEAYKQIANFYVNSYVSVNNIPSDDEMKRLGIKPEIFTKVNDKLDAAVKTLASLGHFTVQDISEIVKKVDRPVSKASTMNMALFIIALYFFI